MGLFVVETGVRGKGFFSTVVTPRKSVRRDLLNIEVTANRRTISNLSRMFAQQYESCMGRLRAFNSVNPFSCLEIDPPEKMMGIDFASLTDEFLVRQMDKTLLDLTHIEMKLAQYRSEPRGEVMEGNMAIPPPLPVPRVPAKHLATEITAPTILKTAKLLTDDLLFNPDSGVPYPRNETEYLALMAHLLDASGRFPGDSDPLVNGRFSEKGSAQVQHATIKRKGVAFGVEVFSPHLCVHPRKNRFVFDADLISQASSFGAYGLRGVSYDRQYYYERRLFECDRAPFVWVGGWPVSFAGTQGFTTSYEERDLYYSFIHFVMTYGEFQGYGLTSYSIRESVSSAFYRNVFRNRGNLLLDGSEQLRNPRFLMWAFAHSGRLSAFYPFAKSFGSVPAESAPIAEAAIRDVHKRITPPEELGNRELEFIGVRRVNGGMFPLAVDHGVYPPHNRYPIVDGRPVLSQKEVNLSSGVKDAWFEAIGGEKGLAEGNSLYFGGLVTFGGIREAKRREKEREGSALFNLGDRTRGWLVRMSK